MPTSANVVGALKAIFSCHSIPATVSDNGLQYIPEDIQGHAAIIRILLNDILVANF